MRRIVALVALSLFVSLTITLVAVLFTRSDEVRAAVESALGDRIATPDEEEAE